MRKTLLIVLTVFIAVFIVVGIWYFLSGKGKAEIISPQESSTASTLKDNKEIALGTIIYPGAKVTEDLKDTLGSKKAIFEISDSLDGAVNIYGQDLANRYKSYQVTKQTIRKTDALNRKAVVINCKGSSGNIIVTAWAGTNGFTYFEIKTSKGFK